MINNLVQEKEISDSLELASSHYENFPVASFLFPIKLRNAVALIYRFARTADDIADEGNDDEKARLQKLETLSSNFKKALEGNYESEYWKLLHEAILKHKLTPQHFLDLLKAFQQDLFKKSYSNYDELVGYCENSANPIGRLILELYEVLDSETIKFSDKICTALQLINFWQDVKIDLRKERIYIPQSDFEKFNISTQSLYSEQINDKLRQIIKYRVDRTRELLLEGTHILARLPFRLKWQIKWTINCGLTILNKIRKNNYDVLNFRPTLTKLNYIIALIKPLKIDAQ